MTRWKVKLRRDEQEEEEEEVRVRNWPIPHHWKGGERCGKKIMELCCQGICLKIRGKTQQGGVELALTGYMKRGKEGGKGRPVKTVLALGRSARQLTKWPTQPGQVLMKTCLSKICTQRVANRGDTLYLHGPVIWVQKNLCQGNNLRGPVPAIWAVNQHWASFPVDSIWDQDGCLQHDGEMLQPLGALERWQPAERDKWRQLSLWLTGESLKRDPNNPVGYTKNVYWRRHVLPCLLTREEGTRMGNSFYTQSSATRRWKNNRKGSLLLCMLLALNKARRNISTATRRETQQGWIKVMVGTKAAAYREEINSRNTTQCQKVCGRPTSLSKKKKRNQTSSLVEKTKTVRPGWERPVFKFLLTKSSLSWTDGKSFSWGEPEF